MFKIKPKLKEISLLVPLNEIVLLNIDNYLLESDFNNILHHLTEILNNELFLVK